MRCIMSYRIMPPGSYYFWRFGMVSWLIRWAFTASVCAVLIITWCFIANRFLLTQPSNQLWCVQCTAQLAELAVLSDEIDASVNQSSEQPLLIILSVCEKSRLVVQSSTSQKPTKKNNVTLQRINLVCAGSLEQIKLFLDNLLEGIIALATVEMQLTKQQDNLYKATIFLETILL